MKKLLKIGMLCVIAVALSTHGPVRAAEVAAEKPIDKVQVPAQSLELPAANKEVKSEVPTETTGAAATKTETTEVVPATGTVKSAEVAAEKPTDKVQVPAQNTELPDANKEVKSEIPTETTGAAATETAATADQSGSNVGGGTEKKSVVKIDGSTVLPLRVLVRPFSSIYSEPSDTAKVVEENIPALQAYYVYQEPVQSETGGTEGWYEVGTDNRGTIVGWMKAKDVFEWKQTMVLSYTHPEGRHPVLMFEKKAQIQSYLNTAKNADSVKQLYTSLETSKVDPASGLISVEPKQFVDFTKQPYFLPILDFESITVGAEKREARLLKIAAVTTGANARESSDIRTNPKYLKEANAKPEDAKAKKLKNLKVDLVWVMDTTKSMRPYIKETLKVVQQASKDITSQLEGGKEVAAMIRFGVWGYRDDESIKGIEYRTKNYTPALQSINDFEKTLSNVDVTQVDSVDYPEDMFSGVNDAMDKTAWSEGSIKVMIIVADAPSHEAGHKWNFSQMTDETLRKLANDRKITIGSLHLRSPDAKQYYETTESQLKMLSNNPGMKTEWYQSMQSEDIASFGDKTKDISNIIIQSVKESSALDTEAASVPGKGTGITILDEPAPAASSENDSKQLARSALRAALVQWIGSATNAEAPRDIVAWATDKDLLDTNIQSLEVRFLINKRQLDSLQTTMKTLVEAGRRGQLSGDDFFSSLQAAAATTARDPEMIKKAKKLSQTGLIPEFLTGLPYKSQIMEMNNDLWMSWSVDEQDNFLAEVESRIKTYETIHNSPDGWIQLNKGDDKDEYVYPISLSLLP